MTESTDHPLRWRTLWRLILSVGWWLASLKWYSFVILVGAALFVRLPIGIYGGHVDQSAAALPLAHNYSSTSVLPSFLYLVLPDAGAFWPYASLLIAIATVAIPVLMVLRQFGSTSIAWRIALVLIGASQVTVVQFAYIGHYANLYVLLAFLSVFVQRNSIAIPMAVLAALSHPELATASYLALLVMSRVSPWANLTSRAIVGSLSGVCLSVAGAAWIAHSGNPNSRLNTNGPDAVIASIKEAWTGIYTWYGPLWLLVIWAVASYRGFTRCKVFFGLVAIPGLVTLNTFDGTRMFAAVSTVLVALLVLAICQLADESDSTNRFHDPSLSKGILGISSFLVLLTPAVVAGLESLPRQQWALLIQMAMKLL